VFILRYIGPFLKINCLSKKNIENQLFHLGKEGEKLIVLYSKFGVSTYTREFKHKIIPNNDISTFTPFSPLLCVYKKGDCELESSDNRLSWQDEKFKKEIPISSNAYMTLGLLELSNYYRALETVHSEKSNLSSIYTSLAQKQLEFYATNLRNFEGVFIDKKNVSDSSSSNLEFEEKSAKFKFSDQALLMAAFYRCSQLCNHKDAIQFKNFSFDILNMLRDYKDSLYDLSSDEISKTCLALNIFYDYTRDESSLSLLLDLNDYLSENMDSESDDDIDTRCLSCINSMLIYRNTGLLNYKEDSHKAFNKIKKTYDPENQMFIKDGDKKEIDYTSEEILLYLASTLVSSDEDDNSNMISNIFKHQIIESGIIGSWPDVPNLGNPERYENFSLRSEDLLDEQNFKMPSIPTPEASEVAPVFLKSITYNKKKNTFDKSKNSFYSTQNMFLFFLFIYLFKPSYNIELLRNAKGKSNKNKSDLADNQNEKIENINTENNKNTSVDKHNSKKNKYDKKDEKIEVVNKDYIKSNDEDKHKNKKDAYNEKTTNIIKEKSKDTHN
jgi:hypothetical protein